MALSTAQKQIAYNAAVAAVPGMSDCEFLAATVAQATAWAAATSGATVAPDIIAQINAFRAANPTPGAPGYPASDSYTNAAYTGVEVSYAQLLCKLG
jgi:hypothetical protein